MMKSVPVQGMRESVAVGARLRSARLERRYTLAETARLAGMTKGFLSRVERDLTSPSVASLVTLCQVLQIEVGSLFTAPRTALVTLAEAPTIDLGGTGLEERLVTGREERAIQMVRAVIEPGGAGASELYALDCDLEVWHVISGALDVRLHEVTHRLGAGDTFSFPGREPHTWCNAHDGETVVLFTLVPDRG